MGLPAPSHKLHKMMKMKSYNETEAAPVCATTIRTDDRQSDPGENEIEPPAAITVVHLAKLEPEYYYNPHGEYQTIKEYMMDQFDAYTCDDLIKAYLALDIFSDILGEGFAIPYGSPDPKIQAK